MMTQSKKHHVYVLLFLLPVLLQLSSAMGAEVSTFYIGTLPLTQTASKSPNWPLQGLSTQQQATASTSLGEKAWTTSQDQG